MIIPNKRTFYDLWKAGLLGNRTLLTDDIDEALGWGAPKIGFRSVGSAGGGAWTLVPREKARETFEEWTKAGRKFLMDGSVPNDKSVLQGEVCRTEKGLQGFLCIRDLLVRDFGFIVYHELSEGRTPPATVTGFLDTTGLPPMRQTMAAGWHHHYGYLQTKLIIERYMDASSRDDLEILLDFYPDATVEFTVFDVNTGLFPHRNTIFWEVRNY